MFFWSFSEKRNEIVRFVNEIWYEEVEKICNFKIAITRKLEGILKFWGHMLPLAWRDLQECSICFFKILTENGSKFQKTVFQFFQKSKKRVFLTLTPPCSKTSPRRSLKFIKIWYKIACSLYLFQPLMWLLVLKGCYKALKFPYDYSSSFDRRENLLVSKNLFFDCLLD